MKTKLLLVSTMLLSLSQAFGQLADNAQKAQTTRTLPVYEGFNYDVDVNLCKIAGSLSGQWASQSDATALDDKIIDSPGWTTLGTPPPSGNALKIAGGGTDPQLIFTTTSTGTLYYSFLTKIDENLSGDPAVSQWTGASPGIQLVSLGQPSTTTIGNTNYGCSVFIMKSGTGFILGINRGSSTNTGDVVWGSTVYTFDTEYFIAASYTFDSSSSTAKLYVIPGGSTVPSTEPTAVATSNAGSNRTNLNCVYIRQDSNAKTPGAIIDELRVGTTWNSGTGTTGLSVAQNEVSGLNVYPNPVSNGVVYINSNSSEAKKVAVYDVLGKQVIAKEVSNGSLNVSSLNKGVYLMKVSEGAATSTKKLIIE